MLDFPNVFVMPFDVLAFGVQRHAYVLPFVGLLIVDVPPSVAIFVADGLVASV